MRHLRAQHYPVYVTLVQILEKQVRPALVAAKWTEHFGATHLPPMDSFKWGMKIDFRCANVQSMAIFCHVHFVISLPGGLVFLEIDEVDVVEYSRGLKRWRNGRRFSSPT
jgi:hypothetical protein